MNAPGLASLPLRATGYFAMHWLQSVRVSWLLMLPIVIFAAPAIRRLAHAVTRE